MPGALDIGTLNALPRAAFEAAVAPLFEGAPRFLARLAAARPFESIDALFQRALEIAREMPEDEQVELIDAHPRLGAPPGSVSALSFVEQGYDQERAGQAAGAETARLSAELEQRNAAYEARFGFRYCVHVAGRPRAALLPEMDAALSAARDDEIRRAVEAVVAIARDRHGKLHEDAREGAP
jgi:2-oxo-4-hydroxy-4-carboxy-5-ureidoimidazoline decarboxylase